MRREISKTPLEGSANVMERLFKLNYRLKDKKRLPVKLDCYSKKRAF